MVLQKHPDLRLGIVLFGLTSERNVFVESAPRKLEKNTVVPLFHPISIDYAMFHLRRQFYKTGILR